MSTAHRPARSSVWLVGALLPLVFATLLCVVWTRQDRLLIGGDEPHYLIMARSVLLDGDLNLRNNYEEDALTGDIYPGALTPHAYRGGAAWPPYHSVGLSLLLAYPFRYAGIAGARLTLIAVSALIPIMVFWWLRAYLSPRSAILLGLTLALSVPLAIGPMRLYPDLAAAALLTTVVLALMEWWRERSVPPMAAWIAVWALAGFLPWLQSRFLAPWLLLVAGGILLALRTQPPWRIRLLAGLSISVAAVAALFALNYALYQNPLGPPRWGELTRSPNRMMMVFLGLHLDQAQGLFMQQPLWLFGLIGLVPFVRAHPREAFWLALVYLSTVGPAAMQMGRYGGEGTIGRYAWAGAFLWAVPLRHFAAANPSYLPRALMLALTLQAIIMLRWITAPEILGVQLDERVWARESLWPSELRYVLPSFYFWDFSGYLRYPPNAVAIAAVALLVWSGFTLIGRADGGHLRRWWWGWLAIAGLVLPASAEKDGSAAEAARIAAAVRASASRMTHRFEAERLPPRSIGNTTQADATASNGEVRSSATAGEAPVFFGPYLALDTGSYSAVAAIRLHEPIDADVEFALLRVTAHGGRSVLAERHVRARDLAFDRYTPVRVPFTLSAPVDDLEFAMVMLRRADVWVDYVEFVPLRP